MGTYKWLRRKTGGMVKTLKILQWAIRSQAPHPRKAEKGEGSESR
jgi:hypothetical protein